MTIHINDTKERFLESVAEELAEYATTLSAGSWISVARLLNATIPSRKETALFLAAIDGDHDVIFTKGSESSTTSQGLLFDLTTALDVALWQHDLFADRTSSRWKDLGLPFNIPFMLRKRIRTRELEPLDEAPTIDGVYFEESAFFVGKSIIDAAFTEDRILTELCTVFFRAREESVQSYTVLRNSQWNSLEVALYALNIYHLKDSYEGSALDGMQWALRLLLPGARYFEVSGSNSYPDCYDALVSQLRKLGYVSIGDTGVGI